MRHYLTAVLDLLQHRIGLDKTQIGIRLQGRPPATCGQYFYAIHPLSFSGESFDTTIQYRIAFGITVTMRTGHIPDDRMAGKAYLGEDGLDSRCQRVIEILEFNRFSLLTEINNRFKAENEYVEPVQWESLEVPPRPVGPEWFSEDLNNADVRNFGIASQITFSGGVQYQTLTDLKP